MSVTRVHKRKNPVKPRDDPEFNARYRPDEAEPDRSGVFITWRFAAFALLAFLLVLALSISAIVLATDRNDDAVGNCTGLCKDGKNGSIGENGTCPASCFNGTNANVTI